MTAPLTIRFPADPTWTPDVRVEIEIDGVTQPDLVRPLAGRETRVLGHATPGDNTLGHSDPLTLGAGRLGDGQFGIGAPLVTHTTLRTFPAGDRVARLRAVDAAGNASPWSQPVTFEHRPPPPPPRNLRVTPDRQGLTWDWP